MASGCEGEFGHVTRDPDDDLRVGTLRVGAGDVANDVVVSLAYATCPRAAPTRGAPRSARGRALRPTTSTPPT